MKKQFAVIVLAAVLLIGLMVYFGISIGPAKVDFQPLSEKMIPRELEADIIPEYRDMERAFACKVDNEIFVVVTRGTKPTTGFEVSVDKMELSAKEEKSVLTVYADFADPEHPERLAQVKSYPYAVVKADMKGLPDQIELKVNYLK